MNKRTYKEKIFTKLKQGGWVSNRALNKVCFRYSARIHELREEGHVIEKKRAIHNPNLFYYKLSEVNRPFMVY